MTTGVLEALGAANGASCLAMDPFSLTEANINPLTGLSTDYLNLFNEAVMLLDLVPSMPECRDDVVQWQPLDYHEHFARSNLKHKELAIAAYDLADVHIRRLREKVPLLADAIHTVKQFGYKLVDPRAPDA